MAERMPHGESSLLARALIATTRLVVRFPWTTLVLSIVFSVLTVWVSIRYLGYNTSRSALMNQTTEYHKRWLAYTAEFGNKEDVVVVVKGQGLHEIVPVLDAVAEEVSRHGQFFSHVLHAIDPAKLRSKGLYYLSVDQLNAIDQFLDQAQPIVAGGWAWLNPGTMAAGLVAQYAQTPAEYRPQIAAAIQDKLLRLVESLEGSLGGANRYCSPWPDPGAQNMPEMLAVSDKNIDASRHLVSDNGQLGFVLLKLVEPAEKSNFVENEKSIAALRKIIDRIKTRFPDVAVGVTGLPVMEHDEMLGSQTASTYATIFSAIGVILVLLAGLGGLRHPLLAMAALGFGMAWSLGFTTVAVGHLNILSSAFGAILMGIGSDYGVYYVARYIELRQDAGSIDEALVQTSRSVAPGITIGAATTAVAFFMSGFTDFPGVSELGIVAGGGIVCCWLATMIVLPAMVRLIDVRRGLPRAPSAIDFRRWLRPLTLRPGFVVGSVVAVTIVLSAGIFGVHYDYNLLNLQSEGLESVELERMLLAESRENSSFAVSITDNREELLARKAAFQKLPSVAKVEEITSLLPTQAAEKRPIVERIRQKVWVVPEAAPSIPVVSPAELGQMLSAAQLLMAQSPHAVVFQAKLECIGHCLETLAPADYYAQLSRYQQSAAADLLARLQALRGAANSEPPNLNDLPRGLVDRFVGRSGKQLIRVYCKNDVWDMDAMEKFVAQIRSVDPEITGNPIQIFEASKQLKSSFEKAGLLALPAILPIVFLNFGTLRHSLLAILPLALATLQMFGLMGFLGIPRNPANVIALPLMLGMGVDNGVHLVHDFLEQRGRYHISLSTAAAVILNTLTTMVGFAALMLAEHVGMHSLGRVLTLGTTCCLFSSILVLPPLLTWLSRNRAETPADEPEQSELGTVVFETTISEPGPAEPASQPEKPRQRPARPLAAALAKRAAL